MEDLNKNQLVLLCILVSFVISIATGILTVSLMNEAPLTVTQTINRVVERTIEKIPGQVQVKEVPVIVTEEDLILKVIKQASPGVAQVTLAGKEVSVGFFLTPDLVAARSIASSTDKTYNIIIGKKKFEAIVADARSLDGLALLKITKDVTEKSLLPIDLGGQDAAITPLKLSENGPVIGQTVVGIDYNSAVSVGIISNLYTNASSTIVKTNAATNENIGGPLLNIKGEVIGISKNQGEAISSKDIKAVVDTLK